MRRTNGMLCAQLLHVINSAVFGVQRQVGDTGEAVMYLGQQNTFIFFAGLVSVKQAAVAE